MKYNFPYFSYYYCKIYDNIIILYNRFNINFMNIFSNFISSRSLIEYKKSTISVLYKDSNTVLKFGNYRNIVLSIFILLIL